MYICKLLSLMLVLLSFFSINAEQFVLNRKKQDIKIEKNANGVVEKYIYVNNVKKDVRDVFREIKNEKEKELGKFDVILAKKIEALSNDREYETVINFDYDTRGFEGEKKEILASKYKQRRIEARDEGIKKLKSSLVIDELKWKNRLCKITGTNKINIRLNKTELIKIKNYEEIASISVPELHPKVEGQLSSVPQNVAFQNAFNTQFYPFSTYAQGAGINVGVLELNQLDEIAASLLLNNVPLTIAYSENAAEPHLHPVYVISIIDNHFNGGNYGGAPSVSNINYYGSGTVDTELGVDWLVETRGCTVINNSWVMSLYLAYWQTNQYARYFDIQAHSNHVTFVVGAGNTGAPNNTVCSSYDPDDEWDESTCEEVQWRGHNSIVVGAVKEDFREIAEFSSWRNNPTYPDEKPHISAPGYMVQSSNGEYLSGTSIATPMITSLIADLQSWFAFLKYSPEMTRAVLMASSCSFTTKNSAGIAENSFDNRFNDKHGGAGVPKADLAWSMLSHSYGEFTDITVQGNDLYNLSASKTILPFYSNKGNGSSRTFKFKCNNVGDTYFNVYLTWVSNPEGTLNIGDQQTCDDIDLYISGNGVNAFSVSVYNSTEAIKFRHNYNSGTVEYTITVYLYNRITNKDIYGALAILPTAE